MSREVIQSLLSLSGVSGVVLASRRNRPYFYGFNNMLDRTKQMLAQGLLQIAENIPDTFDTFTFHFADSSVFVYKLGQGTLMIVITSSQLQINEYWQIIAKIKHLVAIDPYNTIGTLRSLLGTPTNPSPISTNPSAQIPIPTQIPTQIPSPPAPPVAPEYQLSELLQQLNQLSKFTTQFLGKVVVANYWKSTRPQTVWLAEFDIDRNGQLSHPKPNAGCSADQHQQIKQWVKEYMKRCQQVIRNFDQLVRQECTKTAPLNLILD